MPHYRYYKSLLKSNELFLSIPRLLSAGLTTKLTGKRQNAVIEFFSDKEYYQRLYKFTFPISLQNLVAASLNMVGWVMVGQLGAVPVAAVGLANQIFFLLNLMLFGITTGSAMFTAQLWGKRDITNIRKVLGLALTLGLAAAMLFLVIAEVFPSFALGIYSQDLAVVVSGSEYLRIIGFSFPLFAISFCYAIVLRSTGDARTPLVVTFSSLVINTLVSYLLIFGKLGLPALGVHGAAIGFLVARVIEVVFYLILTYRNDSPAAAKLGELFRFDRDFAWQVLKPVLPVVANEILWSLGTSAYSVAYARISTESIAAMNIVSAVDQIALLLFNAMGHACAVLVGNCIGAGDKDTAFRYAARTEALGMLGALGVGAAVIASNNAILSMYNVSPLVIDYARRVLNILGVLLWLRSSNMILFIGIFRSGGDTRFAFFLDGVIIWVVGVPLAFIGAFIFHLPVYWVYLLQMSEEISKWLLGVYRFFSRKWIHNLAEVVGSYTRL
jgi:putative MATE family efflux protein